MCLILLNPFAMSWNPGVHCQTIIAVIDCKPEWQANETNHTVWVRTHQWCTAITLKIIWTSTLLNHLSVNINKSSLLYVLDVLLKYLYNISFYHDLEGGIKKSVPRITDWHHEACRVWSNSDHKERGFLYHPHKNNGFFFLLTHFILENTWKRFQENPEFTEMRHGDVILTLQRRHGTTCH